MVCYASHPCRVIGRLKQMTFHRGLSFIGYSRITSPLAAIVISHGPHPRTCLPHCSRGLRTGVCGNDKCTHYVRTLSLPEWWHHYFLSDDVVTSHAPSRHWHLTFYIRNPPALPLLYSLKESVILTCGRSLCYFRVSVENSSVVGSGWFPFKNVMGGA